MKKLLMIAPIALLVSACATNSDIELLQSQIKELQTNQESIKSSLYDTQQSVKLIGIQSDEAKAASLRAVESTKQVNDKLDRLFKLSQRK